MVQTISHRFNTHVKRLSMSASVVIIIITRLLATSRSITQYFMGAQWLSGRVLDLRPKGRGFEPHRRHSVVSLSKNINPSLVLVQPRKTSHFITERLLMGRKESNQTNKNTIFQSFTIIFNFTTSPLKIDEPLSTFQFCHSWLGTFGNWYEFLIVGSLSMYFKWYSASRRKTKA